LEEGQKETINKILLEMHEEIKFPTKNNAMAVAQYCSDMMNDHHVTLADIEQLLREMHSRVILIGIPLKIYGDKFISRRPNNDELYGFGLWVAMNGPEELKHDLQTFCLTDADIDISLENTGFLFIKQAM